MGRKIGRLALTENDVLYLSEEPVEEDVQRAEKLKEDNPDGFNERANQLTRGWKH